MLGNFYFSFQAHVTQGLMLNSQSIIDALLIQICFGGVFYIDAVLVLGVKRCNHPVVGCEDVAESRLGFKKLNSREDSWIRVVFLQSNRSAVISAYFTMHSFSIFAA